MTFDPLAERGIPLDRQVRHHWHDLDLSALGPAAVDPYTRCRAAALNAMGAEATPSRMPNVTPDAGGRR